MWASESLLFWAVMDIVGLVVVLVCRKALLDDKWSCASLPLLAF